MIIVRALGMIATEDKKTITQLAERYQVTRLLLFGSGADSQREARDIDLAVEGLSPEKFFRFYGDLLFGISKPVDLIDLLQDSRFTRLVRREGLPLYDSTWRSDGS